MADSVFQGILLHEVFQQVAGALKTATVESALYAARTQQMNTVMEQLARTNGLNVTAVRQQADAVKALGITTQESRNTISQMIFAQLDLTKATDLARLAQNAAKISGISSSEALNGIINGIRTQQIEVLRTYGIQVNFEQALARGAVRLNKTRETLTDYERANIALNEVLSKGPRILGAYEISLTTSAGQLQSLTRLTEEAQNAVGEKFAPALQRVVEFLTKMAIGIKDNADEVAGLTTAFTAAGLAAAAFKFTPGPPLAKAAVAGAVGLGAIALGNVDPEAAAIDAAKSAIFKIEDDRRKLQRAARNGRIADKETFLKENKRLTDLELEIERALTERLAAEYKKQRETVSRTVQGDNLVGERATAVKPKVAKNIDLGGGRVLRAEDIEKAIQNVGKPEKEDLSGLEFKIDPKAQAEAQFAAFQAKVKDALRSAQSSLTRARAAELYGAERIQLERAETLNRVYREFAPFDQSLKAGKEYQQLIGLINAEYDELLAKERRSNAIDTIRTRRKVDEAKAQIELGKVRQQIQQASDLVEAKAEPHTEELQIVELRKQRLLLAETEYRSSTRRIAEELRIAREVFQLDGNAKALREAESQAVVASLNAEAQLVKEKSELEHQANVATLRLRREQRKEMEAIYENAQRLAQEEQQLTFNRARDSATRSIRLAQATTRDGDERATQEYVLKTRISVARQESDFAMETIKQQRAAALEAYQRTKDRVELDHKETEFRQRELRIAYDLEKEILDARLDREVEIASIRKRQTEELRQSLGALYDAASRSGRVGIKEFAEGYYNQIKKTIFVNIGEELFRGTAQKLGGIIPGQEKKDPVTGQGTGELTTLGRILRGTPLGIDPAKLAVDAQNRNTQALDRLTGVISGTTGGFGTVRGGTIGGKSGGFWDLLSGSGSESNSGLIIKNLQSQQFMAGGSGGSRKGEEGGPSEEGKLTTAQTALAAAAALPVIVGGIKRGGFGGLSQSAGGALGVASLIPGPQQPFIAGAAALFSLLGAFPGKDRVQEWQEKLEARLNQKYTMPESVSLTEDLTGSSVDYDFRDRLRTYKGAPGTTINISVSAMDSKSFRDNAGMISDAVREQFQLGHPLQQTVKESLGVLV
jgi:hypothetical protein